MTQAPPTALFGLFCVPPIPLHHPLHRSSPRPPPEDSGLPIRMVCLFWLVQEKVIRFHSSVLKSTSAVKDLALVTLQGGPAAQNLSPREMRCDCGAENHTAPWPCHLEATLTSGDCSMQGVVAPYALVVQIMGPQSSCSPSAHPFVRITSMRPPERICV